MDSAEDGVAQRLGLTGTFNPGEYTVRVNTVTTTFRVE